MLDRARRLRARSTDAERKLWQRLRAGTLGPRFRRQQPLGNYIVDFVCFEVRLIVEVDGGQHALNQDYDQARTEWLESQGFRVMRFWDKEVLPNIDSVADGIWRDIEFHKFSSPSP